MTVLAQTFDCEGAQLVGLLHAGDGEATRGAVIVVGGPQYRVGSHRHFVVLAEALAGAGVPVLRFDYRGMGDSDGDFAGFEAIDADIGAAVDHLLAAAPALREVVLIGLCDAASAGMMYARRDPRITGMVVMNPWVRSEASHARATVRHYYLRRLLSRALWQKIFSGQFEWRRSLASVRGLLARLSSRAGGEGEGADGRPYQARMLDGFSRYAGRTLLITSGDDLTAKEFEDWANASPDWRQALARSSVERRHLEAANHTFSSEGWRDQVSAWIVEWLRSW